MGMSMVLQLSSPLPCMHFSIVFLPLMRPCKSLLQVTWEDLRAFIEWARYNLKAVSIGQGGSQSFFIDMRAQARTRVLGIDWCANHACMLVFLVVQIVPAPRLHLLLLLPLLPHHMHAHTSGAKPRHPSEALPK